MDTPGCVPPDTIRTTDSWRSVLDDMESTAAAYRDRGWSTLELHPGDCVLVDSERRTGLDVLLSGSEYEALESLTAAHTFTDVEVFAAPTGEMQYLLIVETDPVAESAAFVPAYFELAGARAVIETASEAGTFRVFCRRLNDDFVVFDHDAVDLFVPDRFLD
ncbi:DUF7529 family protein [Halovivax cerinus]|uniref:Uncharacterized protein n=1 Tax=Halovivax cerinus TaxID=1487865 RepID=A0ABD5NPU5_9EURY|nr:hypothetical protein [Halovivax cerinus]